MSSLTQGQTVFRSTHVRNYTVFSNDLIANPELSWKAKSILMYLLSKPADWQTRLEDIVKHGKDGRDAVLSGLKELKETGYLKKVRITDPATKRVVRWETHVFEYPQSEPDTGNPDSGFPDSGKADATKYGSTNPGKQSTELNMDKRLATQNAARPFNENSEEANQGEKTEQQHSPGKPESQKHSTLAQGSKDQRSAAAPRQKWTPTEGIDIDRQGWLRLPATNSAAPHIKATLSRAKATAASEMQLWLCEQGIREIELEDGENGELMVRHLNDTESLDDAFGRGGSLPLRLLRTLAYEQGLVSQEEFNRTLEEFFWSAWNWAIAA